MKGEQASWFRRIFIIIAIFYFGAWSYSVLQAVNSRNVHIPVLPKDSSEYASLSDSLLENHTFTAAEGVPETFRTPGYPVFLSIIRTIAGGSFLATTFVQIALMLIAGLLVRRIGSRFFSPSVGSIAAIAFLVNPITLSLTLFILSDSLFLFLYILFFWLITENLPRKFWPTILLAGIIAAAALYVRPMGVLAFPIFLAPILITSIGWRRTILSAASITIISYLLISPWLARNHRVSGVYSFTSLTAYNISSYNIPMFMSHKNKTPVGAEVAKIVEAVGSEQRNWRMLSETPPLKPYIREFVKENFFSYLKYHTITTLPFFFASDIQWSLGLYGLAFNRSFDYGQAAIFDLAAGNVGSFLSKITSPWWKFTERLWICFLAACCLYSLARLRRKPAVWIFAGIIMYIALLTGPVSDARYRFSADPFIYLLSSAGFVSFLDSRSHSTRSHRRFFLYRT